MAEIGLLTFTRVALSIGQAVRPADRSTCSTHRFTQPPLLALFCWMRDEDGTVREAEGRLAERRELRAALGLRRVPDDTTLYRFRRRLDASVLEQALSAVVARLRPQPSPPATVAADATGLTPGAISTCFAKRAQDRAPGFTRRHWLQWILAVDVDRRMILAPTARRGPTHDGAPWRPRVDTAPPQGPIGVVLADAACDRERHHQHVRPAVQAYRIMPAQRGRATWHIQGIRAHMRQHCPAPLYRRRGLIERVCSAVKRNLSARAPGRSLYTPCLRALRLGVAYNIYRLECGLCPGQDRHRGCQQSQRMSEIAVNERRPIPLQAEVLLLKAIGRWPVPDYPIQVTQEHAA